MPNYVVLQAVLKEKLIEPVPEICSNWKRSSTHRLPRGCLHTITTSSSGSKGFLRVTAFRQPWCLKA